MKNIVITKTSVINYQGIGTNEFIKNIQSPKSPDEIKLFDTTNYSVKKAFVMNDFDGKQILGEKGLRNFNRNTLFILSALKNGMENEINYFKENNIRFGLTIGSCFGSLQSISDYELEIFEKGPKKINPMGFGNTVLNSPTSRANIWFDIKGQSSTVSCGSLSGAKAIEYAIGQIENGYVDAVFCGGAEELNMQTYLGYYINNYLTKEEKNNCYNGNGTILGEGCAMILLEDEDIAKKRKAKIIGKIAGYGTSFYGSIDNIKNFKTTGILKALENAFNNGETKKDEIEYIFTSTNGISAFDKLEESALIEFFGENLENKVIIPIKSIIGETIGADNLFQMVTALSLKEIKSLPDVFKYSKTQKKLENIKNFEINSSNFQKILLNCVFECGNHSAIIIQLI
ncbi:MAG TPA: beta-ketoacyl synthase [Spirochaetota bacterium]|nr:beta-ketoacyl synthase [Spirochaetota bacterium]